MSGVSVAILVALWSVGACAVVVCGLRNDARHEVTDFAGSLFFWTFLGVSWPLLAAIGVIILPFYAVWVLVGGA